MRLHRPSATFEDAAMSDSIQLREALPEDAPAMAALAQSLLSQLLADPADPATADFRASLNEAAVADRLADPDYRHWLALADGQLVGQLSLRGFSHLYHLFIATDWQRRGVGRQLWLRALDSTLVQAVPAVFTVNAAPAAVPAYERWGFRAVEAPQRQNGIDYVPMELCGPAPAAAAN